MSVLAKVLQSAGMGGTQILFYFGIFLLTAVFLINFIKRRQKVKLLDRVPGPPGNFLFGNAFDTWRNPKELFNVLTGKFCDYGQHMSRVWIFTRPYIFLHKAEAAEVLLSSQKHITKSEDYEFLMPWLRTGLLTSTGTKWHHRRKMLTPSFHFKILEDFVEVFSIKSEKLVLKFQKHQGEEAFNIFEYITHCTLDIILETAVGLSINVQDNPQMDYIKAVHTMSYLVQNRTAKPLLRPRLLYKLFGYKQMEDEAIKVLHNFSSSAIQKRKDERKLMKKERTEKPQEGKKKRLAFLDFLLEKAEEDNTLTDKDIQEEVDTFVFEGHDTTAAAVTFAVFLLGCHPEKQRLVHEELDSIFGENDRLITMEDLRQMKYLECCIKESLRIFPSVPMMARMIHEPMTIDGYTIPAGTTITPVPYRIHRDPKHFPEPEKFLPERFLPENSAGRHPFAYVPFSAGPRNCIGQKFALMEEKVVVGSIFRKLIVESMDRPSNLDILGQLIIRPEKGIHIKVTPRK